MVPKNLGILCFLAIITLHATGQAGFTENRGQWQEPFLYKADIAPGVSVFIDQHAFIFNLAELNHREEDHAATGKPDYNHIHGHAFRIVFDGAVFKDIFPGEPLPGYENFFLTNDSKRWVGGLKKYKNLILKEIWPGIDLKLEISGGRLKYTFFLQKGNNTKRIKLHYEGLEELKLNNKTLELKTSIGKIIENEPIAWDQKGNKIQVSYQLKGNILQFDVHDLLEEESLVIDPELIFSTYTGSTADNWGFCGTYAPDKAVYSGGIVFSTGYPVSIGAWQQNFAGICDVGIIKYDSTGTQRLWATYLGGQYADLPHSMIVNEARELVILGTTGSLNFPVTSDAFDTTFNGGTALNYASLSFPQGSDMFITILSEDGTQLKGSTYIGGSDNDGLNFRQRYASYLMAGNDSLYFNYGDGARGEVITNNANEIIAGSCTFSQDFPTSVGAPQQASGGKQDGVVYKFDRYAQHLLFSTYCGGSGDEAIYSVALGSEGNLYFAGGTNSDNLPVTSGTWQSSRPGGSADGFAGYIIPGQTQFAGLTYFGSQAYDQVYFIKTGPDGYPYLYGQTKASGNTLMINATYGLPNSGQFIAKLSPNLSDLLWSTVFGTGDGKPNISPTAFMVDVCNRIYISGWGRIFGNSIINGVPYPWGSVFGTVGMPVTLDAIQSQTDGQDFYVAVFSPNASGLDYATFFGELHYAGCSFSGHDHVDGGTSRFDPQGNIIQSVCASCGSCQQFPTSPNPGAWSNSNNSWNCNNAVFKIKLKSDFALAGFEQPTSGCAPLAVQFKNTGRGTSFEWDFGDPASGSSNSSTQANPVHTFQHSGIYPIRQIACLPGSCNGCDTLVRHLLVLSDTTIRLDTLKICKGEWIQAGMMPVPGSNATYQWIPASGLSASTIPNPMTSPSATTDYICLVSHGGCTDTLLQRIEVSNIGAFAGNDTTVCSPAFTLTGNSGARGSNFQWSSSPLFTDTLNSTFSDSTATINLLNFGSHFFYLKVINAECEAIDSIFIDFQGTEIEAGGDRKICKGDTVHLQAVNLFASHPVTWYWQPSAAILGNNQQPNVTALPDSTTLFIVTATTSWGCVATDTVKVEVSRIEPNAGSLNCSCHDLCNGSAWVAPAGGFPPYTVSFSNGVTGNLFQQLCPGEYLAYITDSLGCDTAVHFFITAPSVLKVEAQITPPLCHGDSTGSVQLQISGGTPPYMVQWSNGATGNALNNLAAGTYLAWISDVNDCDTTIVVQIVQPSAIQVTPHLYNPLCNGQSNGSISLWIEGATPPYTVVWNTGAQGDSIGNLQAGSYTALVSDNAGCDTIVNLVLTEPEALQTFAVINPPLCYGQASGSIQLTVSGGIAPYSLLWSTGDTSTLLHQLEAGSYSLTVTDNNGCQSDTAFSLISPPPFIIYPTLHHVTCMGWGDGAIDVNVQGATPPYVFQWNTGQTGPNLNNLSGGLYILTITDAYQCDTTLSFNIIEATNPLQVEFLEQMPSCFGYSDGQLIAKVKGGISPYQISWQNGLIGDTIKNVPAGIYSAVVTDLNGCTILASDTVLQPDSISIQAQIIHQRCGGGQPDGSIHLSILGGTPPYNLSWNNGMNGLDIDKLSAGVYQATITDTKGCQYTYTAIVHSPAPLVAEVITNPASCHDKADGNAILHFTGGTEPYTFIWEDASNDNPRWSMTPGHYPFKLIDAVQCTLIDTVFITAPAPLSGSEMITPPECEASNNASVQIEAEGGTPPYHIVWEDGSLSFFRNMLAPAIYSYTLSDSHQCQYTDTMEIKLPDCSLFIPNVFTPNGDGVNDYFIIKGIENFPHNQLLILNRWGREILQFSGYKNEWDGRDGSGSLVAEGVYYFILKLSNGKEYHGSVTIIR